MHKQYRVNEEQLKNIIQEVDINGIIDAAKEYGNSSEENKEDFEDKLNDAINDDTTVSETKEKKPKKNLEESEKNSIFAEVKISKKDIYEAVQRHKTH